MASLKAMALRRFAVSTDFREVQGRHAADVRTVDMQIAFLDSWFQDITEGSGTAAAIGGLQHALVRSGHSVIRLTPHLRRPRHFVLRRLLFNQQLPTRLRARHFDLVVGFDIDGFLWSTRRPNAAVYVSSIKGVIAEELRHERGHVRWALQAMARLERHNCRNADAVITTSEYCRDAICRHYGVPRSRVVLVPEGIDFARWQQVALDRRVANDGATILCVARQYPRKHISDLLRALPIVRNAVPNARAIIVGGGPEHDNLVALANRLSLSAVVEFTGAVSQAALARAYGSANVFCLPTLQEGFGIVFLEAMACGLPIVAACATAVPEVVPAGRAGLLVPPGDIDALAGGLIAILQDRDRRAAFGEYGQLHAAQFDWDRIATMFIAQVGPFMR